MEGLEESILSVNGGVKKSSYTYKEIAHICSQVVAKTSTKTIEIPSSAKRKPTVYKKGDVVNGSAANFKMRPFVIVKKTNNGYYCIPLTSDVNDYSLVAIKSRFFKGYLCGYMVILNDEHIHKNFIGILDDNRSINKAVKEIAEKFKREFL